MKKVNKFNILCWVTIIIIIITLTISYKYFSYKDIIKIGVTNSENIAIYEKYLNKSTLSKYNIKFVYVGNSKDSDEDPFNATFDNIRNAFSDGSIDMMLAVEEDYLIPIANIGLFYNINGLINIDNLPISIKNFISCNNEIYFLPSSLDSVRLLIVNNNILQKLGIPIPKEQFDFNKFCNLIIQINDEIVKNNLDNTYAISLGTPIDEFLYDDISKFLMPLYNETDLNLYLEYYVKLMDIAKKYSYRRKDISYKYPLDFQFAQNNIALKIATTYEIELFKNKYLSDTTPYKPYIKDFSISILPHPYIENFNYTLGNIELMAISSKTKHLNECIDIMQFFLSEEHAIDSINLNNPFSSNIVSTPLIRSEKVFNILENKYSFSNFHYGTNFAPLIFQKNYDSYWQSKTMEDELVNRYVNEEINAIEFKLLLSDILKNK